MKNIKNNFILTKELCVNYTRFHHFKIIRMILNISTIGFLLNIIMLLILNLIFDKKNMYLIIFTLIVLLLSLITNFVYLTWCGVINFYKTKNLKPTLNYSFIFSNDEYTVKNGENIQTNQYKDIKKIHSYFNFFVITTINNEEYILPHNGFNCEIEKFEYFIEKEIEKCEKE